MRSVAVTHPNAVEVVDIPTPEPGPYDALVKTECAYICNATDRKIIEGHFPGIPLSEYPLLLGHEGVGIVQETGTKVRSFKPHDRVLGGYVLDPRDDAFGSAWGGFSEFTLVRDHLAMVQDGVADEEHGWTDLFQIQKVIPQAISAEDAGLILTWREVWSAFEDFRLKPGNDVIIFGAGPVGLSFVMLGRERGLREIVIVDSHENKQRAALDLGASKVLDKNSPELDSLVANRGATFDAVIDAVGSAAIVSRATSFVDMGQSICVYGVVADPEIRLPLAQGPYNFNLYLHQWPTKPEEAKAHDPIVELLVAGKISAEHFKSAEFPVEQIQSAVDHVNSREPVKTLIRF